MKYLTLFYFIFLLKAINAQCPLSGVEFINQSQVDSFIINYPNCTNLLTGINIGFSNINNLEGLRNIKSISSNLSIVYNEDLNSVEGFRNLEYIGGSIHIENSNLQNGLEGFRSLESINLIRIKNCNSLKDLYGLRNVREIENNIKIWNNDELVSLLGLENILHVGSSLSIFDNPALKDIKGLKNLKTIGTSISTTSVQSFFITNNPNLESLDGLENLKIVHGINISGNDNINNLHGLISLDSITDDGLTIRDNQNLQSLEGAPLLKHINGAIEIRNNPSLTTLSGLDEVDATTVTDLIIKDNESLSDCAIYSVCRYLDLDGPRDIEFNLDGCNNEQEIQDACELVATSEIDSKLLDIDISPIPAQDYLQVSLDPLSEISQFRYFIYDTTGKELLSGRSYSHHASIDVSYLNAGVYSILIDADGSRSARLWVKM